MARWLFLFLIFCLLEQAGAQAKLSSHLPASRVEFFNQLKSPVLEVVDEANPYFDEELGDYPLLARIVQKDILKWDPKGKPRRVPEKCNSFQWQKKSMEISHNSSQWVDEFWSFLKDCEDSWKTPWTDVATNALGMMSFKLNPSRYPYGRHVILHLPNQLKIKGLLAMKTDQKKRPFVVFRTGIFSNTQEFYPERFLFFQMFEQSPFNILVLESSSGSEFFKHNNSFALGGFDEGLQNFWIARALQNPNEPISKLIESVHLMGLSMGGHGAMFGALVNQYNPNPQGKPYVQSVLAFCPLLNMQETFDYHRSQGLTMDMMNYWASRRLKVINEKVPGLRSENFIPDFFDWIKKNYKGPLIAENGELKDIRLPQEIEKMIKTSPTPENLYWNLNHFWPWFHDIKTPILIFSTQHDPIVSWFINTGRLGDGRLDLRDSNVRAYTFEEGYHCSLPIAYDWAVMASLFQTSILKMSPDFQQVVREHRVPLSKKILESFPAGEKVFLDLKFEVFQQTADLFTTVRFDLEVRPTLWARLWAPKMTAHLPLSEMDFPIDQVVRSEDESSLLSRWAYQNISARIDGSDLVFSWKVAR